jgi:ABC-type uncharacterized transport system permease subunit
MSNFFLISLLVAGVYAYMAWFLYRSPSTRPAWLKFLLPAALVAHGGLVYASVLGQGAITLGFGNSLSTIAWLTACIYWLTSYRYPLARIQSWVSALAAVAVLLPLFFTGAHAIPNSEALALRAHLIVSLLAYGFLAIAALHAVLMTTLEKKLHRASALSGGAPPLLTLEAVLFRTLTVGFVLLTLAVSSGVVFSEELFGKPLQFTHKIVFALLSWLTFGALLLGRRLRGWRGRTALYWTLTGFVFLLLSYVGTQFVLEVLLHRQG